MNLKLTKNFSINSIKMMGIVRKGVERMQRKISLIIITFLIFAIGCSKQENSFTAKGSGEYWEVNMEYTLSDGYQEDTGSLKYNGDEQLKKVYYEFNYPPPLGWVDSGERNVTEEEQTVFRLPKGRSGGTNSFQGYEIESFREAVNETTVTIRWKTTIGENEEIVKLKAN